MMLKWSVHTQVSCAMWFAYPKLVTKTTGKEHNRKKTSHIRGLTVDSRN